MPERLPYRIPHYYLVDIWHVLGRAEPFFYFNLCDGGIRAVLHQMKLNARSYQKFIGAYPAVRCEPLESFYLFRRGADMLDEEHLCDLLFCYSWREANWGAWLAALAPRPAYLPHLARRVAAPGERDGSKVFQLALAACGNPLPQELSDLYAVLEEVRETLDRLPSRPAPLRRDATRDQERAFNRERLVLLDAFRSGGVEAAKNLLTQGIIGYFGMSYPAWLAAGAPDAPAVPRVRKLRHRVLPRF